MIKTFTITSIAAAAAATHMNKNLAQLLAQVGLETENAEAKHSCLTSAKRNLAAVDDFWTLLSSGQKYSDDDFTPDGSSVYWADMGEGTDSIADLKLKWKRATEIPGDHSLFGKGISPDDIIQGNVGNCWLLAAASAVAEVPGRMEKTFLDTTNKLNDAGIYAVNLYTLGVPHTVVVDDWVPRTKDILKPNKIINAFAEVGFDSSLWGTILEKAYAKSVGNYLHTQAGNMGHGVRAITGAPFEEHAHKDITVEDLWTELVSHDGKNDVITASSGPGNDTQQNEHGLTLGHAFTILGTHVLPNGTRLVKIRNPWGLEDYRGAWSDFSKEWTPELEKEVNLKKTKKDGIFYQSIEDYHKQFGDTVVSYDNSDWNHAYFLRLNDDGTKSEKCGPWEGEKCFRHVLSVTSEVD